MFGRFISYFLIRRFRMKNVHEFITVDWTEIHSHMSYADVDNNALQRDELITRTSTLTHTVLNFQYNWMSERRERDPHT